MKADEEFDGAGSRFLFVSDFARKCWQLSGKLFPQSAGQVGHFLIVGYPMLENPLENLPGSISRKALPFHPFFEFIKGEFAERTRLFHISVTERRM